MDGYANHRGTQYAIMELVACGEFADDGPVRMFLRFHTLDGLVLMGIELLPLGLNALETQFRQRGPQSPVDQIEPFAEFLVPGVAVGFERAFKVVENRKDGLDRVADGAMVFRGAVSFDALAIVLKIRLQSHKRIQQIVPLGSQRIELGSRNGRGSRLGERRIVHRRSGGCRSLALGMGVVTRLFK